MRNMTLVLRKEYKWMNKLMNECLGYHCAFVGDVLFQGVLYVTQNWFCFYSKLLGRKSVSHMQHNYQYVTRFG